MPEAEEEEKEERREGEAKGNSDFFLVGKKEGNVVASAEGKDRGKEKICAKKSFCTACYRKLRDNGVVRKVL